MNETDIRKYAELMKELELTALEIKDGDKVVRLERNISVRVTETVQAAPVASPASAPAAFNANAQVPVNSNCFTVKSPLVGVFYAGPAENVEPFVSIGDHVKRGQTLCIIEAMKLMNEIYADEDGVIEEICVTNGQVVDYGPELFRIKR